MNRHHTFTEAGRNGIRNSGFTYVELMLTLAISSMILLGLSGVLNQALQSQDVVSETNRLGRDARFAMQRMTTTVAASRLLLIPQVDKADTNWPENIREETVPASAPIGSSTKATAVLAVTLPAYADLDQNNTPDADNDGDGLLDEDPGADIHNDDAAGIYLIDDGGNGTVDEGPAADDDEKLSDADEDPLNGVDDDDDGNFDEDPAADMNGDGCPGICGVDDDNNGTIDNGNIANDDEEGGDDEDWYDPVVYFLSGNQLIERTPVPWDTNADSVVTGRDYVEAVIANDVTRFRIELVVPASNNQLIDITLELTSPLSGETISLQTQLRLGGAL